MKVYQSIISNFKTRKDVLENFFWLSFVKILKAVVGLIITAWLARYLGQESFGVWNYALAFIAISSALSTLGLDTIFIRDIVRNSENKDKIFGSAFFLKAVSSFIAFIACLGIAYFIRSHSALTKLIVTIMALSFLFQSFDVIDFYFKSQMESRYVAYARSIPFLFISLVQIMLIVNHAPLILFAWSFLLESILAAALLIVFYKFKGGKFSRWKVDQRITIQLLKNGWPLFISFISSMLYLKVDQIMIGQMLGERAVGVFSVALKIYEIPFAFLVLLTSSVFPKIVEVYERDKELFYKRYSQVTSLYTFGSIVLLIMFIFWGKQIILVLFGNDYLESYVPLILLSMGLVFIYNGMLRSSYLAITNNEKIIFFTSVASAVLNIVLNYIFIRKYGIAGSAMATLITHFVALFLFNYFFKATKRIYRIQLEAFFKLNFFQG